MYRPQDGHSSTSLPSGYTTRESLPLSVSPTLPSSPLGSAGPRRGEKWDCDLYSTMPCGIREASRPPCWRWEQQWEEKEAQMGEWLPATQQERPQQSQDTRMFYFTVLLSLISHVGPKVHLLLIFFKKIVFHLFYNRKSKTFSSVRP